MLFVRKCVVSFLFSSIFLNWVLVRNVLIVEVYVFITSYGDGELLLVSI